MANNQGGFVWYELMTPAARAPVLIPAVDEACPSAAFLPIGAPDRA